MYTGSMQLNTSAAGINNPSIGITSQGEGLTGQAADLTGGFAAILSAIVSGINGNSALVDANGKPLNIDEITKGLLADNGSGISEGLNGMIQQLMAQYQVQIIVQPATDINAEHNVSVADLIAGLADNVELQINPESKSTADVTIPVTKSGKDGKQNSADQPDNNIYNPVNFVPAASINNTKMPGSENALISKSALKPVNDELSQALLAKKSDATKAMPKQAFEGELAFKQSADAALPQTTKAVNSNIPVSQNITSSNITTAPEGKTEVALFNKGTGVSQQASGKASGMDELMADDDTLKIIQVSSAVAEKSAAIVKSPVLEAVSTAVNDKTGDKAVKNADVPKETGDGSSPVVQAQHAEYRKNDPVVKETVHVSKLNEISEPIEKALGSGNKHIVIQLNPPDLGKIRITLTMDNGVLKADFKVDSQAVKDLFTTAMPQIKTSLENNGLKAGDFFVDLKKDQSDSRDQQQANSNFNQQQQKQQKKYGNDFYDFFA